MSSLIHSPKNKTVAFILAWFLFGQFGTHYFYLGNKRTGKIRLVLGLLVVPLPFLIVLAILEGFQYLRDSKDQFADRVAQGGGIANCWQKTAAVTIAGTALIVTALAFMPDPPPPDPVDEQRLQGEHCRSSLIADMEAAVAEEVGGPGSFTFAWDTFEIGSRETVQSGPFKGEESHYFIVNYEDIHRGKGIVSGGIRSSDCHVQAMGVTSSLDTQPVATPIPTLTAALDQDTTMEACSALGDAIRVGEMKGYSVQRTEMEIRATLGWSHDQLIRALELCVDFIDREK